MRILGTRPAKAGAAFAAAVAVLCMPLALGAGGCGGTGCGAVDEPAVEVSVYDADTGAPAAEGAVGTLRDGDYLETMRESSFRFADPNAPSSARIPLSLSGALERRGRYTVRVEKPGYEPWERTGVRAASDACGVTTTQLRADLRPLRP